MLERLRQSSAEGGGGGEAFGLDVRGIVRLFGALQSNGFASGIYLHPAMTNHSCRQVHLRPPLIIHEPSACSTENDCVLVVLCQPQQLQAGSLLPPPPLPFMSSRCLSSVLSSCRLD